MSKNYLYYWRAYRENTANGPIYKLNQNSPNMAAIEAGDRVWCITYRGAGEYALVAVFGVEAVGENPVGSRERAEWGRRFFRSSPALTVYFDPASQPSVEPVVRRLGLTTNADVLGQSLQGRQGVQQIGAEPAHLLELHARSAEVDTRLSTRPAVETWRLGLADQDADEEGASDEPPEKREYRRELALRNRRQVQELKTLYGGKCQVSGEKPVGGLAGDITEAHHIHWLTRGGADRKENMVVLSPDMHRAVHALDAEFDWADLCFVAGDRRLLLKLNLHLQPKSRKRT